MRGAQLFECTISVGSVLVENRYGQFYVVRFYEPQWLDTSDRRHQLLSEVLASLNGRRIEQTFDAEQALQQLPEPATA